MKEYYVLNSRLNGAAYLTETRSHSTSDSGCSERQSFQHDLLKLGPLLIPHHRMDLCRRLGGRIVPPNPLRKEMK